VAKRWLDKDVENENGYCLKGIKDHLRSSYVKRLNMGDENLGL
jgi:hypothetical protein